MDDESLLSDTRSPSPPLSNEELERSCAEYGISDPTSDQSDGEMSNQNADNPGPWMTQTRKKKANQPAWSGVAKPPPPAAPSKPPPANKKPPPSDRANHAPAEESSGQSQGRQPEKSKKSGPRDKFPATASDQILADNVQKITWNRGTVVKIWGGKIKFVAIKPDDQDDSFLLPICSIRSRKGKVLPEGSRVQLGWYVSYQVAGSCMGEARLLSPDLPHLIKQIRQSGRDADKENQPPQFQLPPSHPPPGQNYYLHGPYRRW